MKTSIVIPTYDRQEDLIQCLESVLAQTHEADEIVIIDDGEYAETRQQLSDEGILKSVKHFEGANETLPAARNMGVEKSSGEIVCFIDDDVILPPNWLDEIIRVYEDDSEAKGVGGYVLNYNPKNINKANTDSLGYRLLTGSRLALFYDRVGDISPVGILWAPHIFMTGSTRNVDALQGCNMSFRREIFDGYEFNEWYGATGSAACEELDFCARLSSDGHKLIYNPRAVVLHRRSMVQGSRREEPNYNNIMNLSYLILSGKQFSVYNFILFCCLISIYSLLKLDLGFVKATARGLSHYIQNNLE